MEKYTELEESVKYFNDLGISFEIRKLKNNNKILTFIILKSLELESEFDNGVEKLYRKRYIVIFDQDGKKVYNLGKHKASDDKLVKLKRRDFFGEGNNYCYIENISRHFQKQEIISFFHYKMITKFKDSRRNGLGISIKK